MGPNKMSCLINDNFLERLYEDYLELGYTEEEAATKAYEEFNSRIPPRC